MTTITSQFTAYLHRHAITWGSLDTFGQYQAWVAFLVEWKRAAQWDTITDRLLHERTEVWQRLEDGDMLREKLEAEARINGRKANIYNRRSY